MAEYGSGLGGGCCFAIVGAFQQYFNTTQWGMNWTCCDTCCQCKCCWDEGEFDPNDRPGAASQQESGPKAADGVQRGTEAGDEGLPAYKPNEQMSVPSGPVTGEVVQGGNATGAPAVRSSD